MKREPPAPLALPAKSEAEQASALQFAAIFTTLAAEARQENLQAAVRLAQQAARGEGPLVEHFAELGRRYGDAPWSAGERRPDLRVIEGGVA